MKAFKVILLSLFLLFLSSGFIKASALFEIRRTTCYEFFLTESPEAEIKHERKFLKSMTQIWCYHRGDQNQAPLFVFNADQAVVKLELSFTVDENRNITHGSLQKGQITFHKVNGSEFNPFPVPINEPLNLKPVSRPTLDIKSAESVLNTLISIKSQNGPLFLLQEGEFSSFESAAVVPWRGFWWPYKNQPLSGSENSPLAKYDKFVQSQTGISSTARSWENANHRYKGVGWEGHCNGWAASSILRQEPRFSRFDLLSGITFTVADQKGILAETDYCVVTAFFGKRNRGRATDNPLDIDPALFHKTLIYYIGSLKKSVIIDYRADTVVYNQPVSGYNMNLRKISTTAFEVIVNLTYRKFDSSQNYPPGLAPAIKRTYQYILNQNDQGQIIGGFWQSKNPDFIWVPLSIKDCGNNNPHVNHGVVESLLNLPELPDSPLALIENKKLKSF